MTLLEAPYGGEWWRGQASAGVGWFPKSHVEYVDRETERKKSEEGECVEPPVVQGLMSLSIHFREL